MYYIMSYGIPEELTYDNLKRMFPAVKSEYRKQPFNGTSFTSGDIQLKLNKMNRSFLNPATLCINFRVAHRINYGATAAATAGVDAVAILGNAESYFSLQSTYPVSGQWKDSITYPALAVNTIMNLTTSTIEKNNMISYGFDSSTLFSGLTNKGDIVSNASTAANVFELVYRSYSIPVVGVLQQNKMIPLFCDEIEIDLTVNAAANFIVTFLATANSSYGGFTIDEIEIVGDVLTLEESGFNELLKMYPNGMTLKTESWLYGTSSLPAAGKGTFDINYSHGLSSLKKFIWWASPAGQWEGLYGGVNPNLMSYNLIIGANSYPTQNVKAYSVAEQFYQNQKSFGAFNSTSHCGSVDRYGIAKCSSQAAGSKYTIEFGAYRANKPTLAEVTSVNASIVSNKYYCSLDLETINQLNNSLYSGISTKGSSNLLRISVAETLANVLHNITFYSVYDTVLTFDWKEGQILSST